jgi:hypothetical protein
MNEPNIFRWPVVDDYEIEVRRTLTGYEAVALRDGDSLTHVSKRIDLSATFERCVWKGSNGTIHSRLFRNKDAAEKTAVFVAFNTSTNQLNVVLWPKTFNDDTLKASQPLALLNDQGRFTINWVPLPTPRLEVFDDTADADVIREIDYFTTGWEYASGAAYTIGGIVVLAASFNIVTNSALWSWDMFMNRFVYPAKEAFGLPALLTATAIVVADRFCPEYVSVPACSLAKRCFTDLKAMVTR